MFTNIAYKENKKKFNFDKHELIKIKLYCVINIL